MQADGEAAEAGQIGLRPSVIQSGRRVPLSCREHPRDELVSSAADANSGQQSRTAFRCSFSTSVRVAGCRVPGEPAGHLPHRRRWRGRREAFLLVQATPDPITDGGVAGPKGAGGAHPPVFRRRRLGRLHPRRGRCNHLVHRLPARPRPLGAPRDCAARTSASPPGHADRGRTTLGRPTRQPWLSSQSASAESLAAEATRPRRVLAVPALVRLSGLRPTGRGTRRAPPSDGCVRVSSRLVSAVAVICGCAGWSWGAVARPADEWNWVAVGASALTGKVCRVWTGETPYGRLCWRIASCSR